MNKIVIELPGIKAVSRNETTGHFIKYFDRLVEAEQWMNTYGKRLEYHFEKQVDVAIDAYYEDGARKVATKRGMRNVKFNAADTPNIDDKIFTDILIRYKNMRSGKKMYRTERPTWFLEDDKPKYLRYVIKRSIPSDHYKVVITISEVEVD